MTYSNITTGRYDPAGLGANYTGEDTGTYHRLTGTGLGS